MGVERNGDIEYFSSSTATEVSFSVRFVRFRPLLVGGSNKRSGF